MLVLLQLFIFFLTSQAFLTPIKIDIQDPELDTSYLMNLEKTHHNPTELHEAMLLSGKLLPNGFDKLSFHKQKVNIDGEIITRTVPIIDGLIVEGADGIYK